MSLTSTTETIRRLEKKIEDLESELRAADKKIQSLLKMNEDLSVKYRKQKATVGILRRAILILNDPEED